MNDLSYLGRPGANDERHCERAPGAYASAGLRF
jgi:hypothetical protein